MGLFHKTLGEWLQSEASGMFFTDASEAALRLGEYLWTCFEARDEEQEITKSFRWEKDVLDLLPKLLPCMPQWSDGGALKERVWDIGFLGTLKEILFYFLSFRLIVQTIKKSLKF